VKTPEKIQEEKKAETTEKNDKEQNSEKVDHKKNIVASVTGKIAYTWY